MPDKGQAVLIVTSPAFKDGELMPSRYTSDGENVSPAIAWENVPEGTRSLVIIMDDPDIPASFLPLFTWNHWVVYNVPPTLSSLPEAVPATETIECGAQQGVSSYGTSGYRGPDPVSGTHRYCFKVYAINRMIDLEPKDVTKKMILKAIDGHILAKSVLVGKYKKQRRA